MGVSRVKRTLAFLLLALFLSLKLGGLHVLAHGHEKGHSMHCPLCEHVVANNLLPVTPADVLEIQPVLVDPIAPQKTKTSYQLTLNGELNTCQLFSRPPPLPSLCYGIQIG